MGGGHLAKKLNGCRKKAASGYFFDISANNAELKNSGIGKIIAQKDS